jgi:hypothetical protein
MGFYARLKKGEVETPRYGEYIYPDENGKYILIEDRYRKLVEQDTRVEILEQEAMQEIVDKNNELIDDTVFGHWRQSEKRIAIMTDKETLREIVIKAKTNGKTKIAEMAQDRIDELS